MINLKGSQFLIFELDGEDFITTDNFVRFVVIEEAGNYLPHFELEFKTNDLELLKKFKESSVVKVSFGVDSEVLSTQFIVLEKEFWKQGSYHVNVKGIFNAPSYIYGSKVAYYEGNSVQVIQQVVSQTFKEISLTSRTPRDNQTWIQYNISDRKFITEVWLHSYFSSSDLLLVGITSFGKFKALTLKDITGLTPWKAFGVYTNIDDRGFIFSGDIRIKSHTGFINKVFSDKEYAIYDRVQNSYNLTVVQPSPILGLTTDPDTNSVMKLQGQFTIDPDNVHPNFILAYNSNIANLFFLSRTEVEITVGARFYPFEVLDPVYIVDTDPKTKGFEDLYSGMYIISRIARTFTNQNTTTILTLSRDTLNLQ